MINQTTETQGKKSRRHQEDVIEVAYLAYSSRKTKSTLTTDFSIPDGSGIIPRPSELLPVRVTSLPLSLELSRS